jgi:NAD(P)-dependent dehydrogenase (short-subunit alcohol dehydrogenase family)
MTGTLEPLAPKEAFSLYIRDRENKLADAAIKLCNLSKARCVYIEDSYMTNVFDDSLRHINMVDVLEGNTAVVTGGASGIGRQIGLTFAEHGADVVIADLRRDPRNQQTPTDALISDTTDSEAKYVECDVTDLDSLENAVNKAVEMGGLDIMLNNAGIFRLDQFFDVSPEEFGQIIDINAKGVFFGAQVAARQMKKQGSGVIINLSSTAALHGSGDRIAYSGSKAAVKAMTYGMADKLGPEGIRVNAILPGLIETSMADWAFEEDVVDEIQGGIPSRRFGTPEDIAEAALFLAGDTAAYVNGEALVVDGGQAHT